MTNQVDSQPRLNVFVIPSHKNWSLIALVIIICLAAGLRLINMGVVGDGHSYTAAVKNMLQSPLNFFCEVTGAGGVTVDKPLVALWIQAAFAGVLVSCGATLD